MPSICDPMKRYPIEIIVKITCIYRAYCTYFSLLFFIYKIKMKQKLILSEGLTDWILFIMVLSDFTWVDFLQTQTLQVFIFHYNSLEVELVFKVLKNEINNNFHGASVFTYPLCECEPRTEVSLPELLPVDNPV